VLGIKPLELSNRLDVLIVYLPAEQAKSRIFQQDVDAIAACDVLVIVLDGRTVDEGASFELGYAFALGKVCVGIKTDPRMLLPIGDNPMIEVPLRRIFREESDLIDWLASYGRGDNQSKLA
jgi:hypothetical protein